MDARAVIAGPGAARALRDGASEYLLKPVTQAAGSFPGQSEAIASVGSWSFVLARPGLDETAAYRLAKALHDLERVGNPPPQLVDTTAKNTLAVAPPGRLHAGVARYFREAGLGK